MSESEIKSYYRNVGNTRTYILTQGDGVPLVLLHGYLSGSYSFAEDIPRLAEAGFKVFAIDLPGFGYTSPLEETHSISKYADFLHEFLKVEKIEPAILVGTSLGGLVALECAKKYPYSIYGLALHAPPFCAQIDYESLSGRLIWLAHKVPFLFNSLSRVMKSTIGCWVYLHILFPELKLMNPKVMRKLVKEVSASSIRAVSELMDQVIGQQLPSPITLQIPTLLLFGDRDGTVPHKIGEQIQSSFKNCDVKYLSDATHNLPLDAPDLFCDAVLDFLNANICVLPVKKRRYSTRSVAKIA